MLLRNYEEKPKLVRLAEKRPRSSPELRFIYEISTVFPI
jgi:hypothetical protein